MFETNELLKPWPFKTIKKPWYEGWPFPSVTGEGKTVFTAQKYGWVYRTRAIKYPWAPDVYLAFIWRYPGDDGARHVELAVSRNGRDWKLFGTNWYIPTGATDEEITMYGLLRRGNEIWQYVNEGAAHGGSAPRYWSRYKQRLDGFVSLDAGAKTGTATTLPLRFQGNHLTLNIKAAGSAKVAITDENEKAFPGFGFDDCDQIKGDFVEKTVTWKGNGNVKELAGKTVRLKFQMQNTKLYAFEFTTPVPKGASGRVNGDAAKYNASAVRVMKKHGIQVNDLYALAMERQEEIQRPRNVHFKEPEGYEVLARQVASSIEEALN
jgi:hypothetical protein